MSQQPAAELSINGFTPDQERAWQQRNRRQLALNSIAEYDRATRTDGPYSTDLIHNLADHLACLLDIPSYPVRAAKLRAQQTAGAKTAAAKEVRS